MEKACKSRHTSRTGGLRAQLIGSELAARQCAADHRIVERGVTSKCRAVFDARKEARHASISLSEARQDFFSGTEMHKTRLDRPSLLEKMPRQACQSVSRACSNW